MQVENRRPAIHYQLERELPKTDLPSNTQLQWAGRPKPRQIPCKRYVSNWGGQIIFPNYAGSSGSPTAPRAERDWPEAPEVPLGGTSRVKRLKTTAFVAKLTLVENGGSL